MQRRKGFGLTFTAFSLSELELHSTEHIHNLLLTASASYQCCSWRTDIISLAPSQRTVHSLAAITELLADLSDVQTSALQLADIRFSAGKTPK